MYDVDDAIARVDSYIVSVSGAGTLRRRAAARADRRGGAFGGIGDAHRRSSGRSDDAWTSTGTGGEQLESAASGGGVVVRGGGRGRSTRGSRPAE